MDTISPNAIFRVPHEKKAPAGSTPGLANHQVTQVRLAAVCYRNVTTKKGRRAPEVATEPPQTVPVIPQTGESRDALRRHVAEVTRLAIQGSGVNPQQLHKMAIERLP
jgi:hypothetical protein